MQDFMQHIKQLFCCHLLRFAIWNDVIEAFVRDVIMLSESTAGAFHSKFMASTRGFIIYFSYCRKNTMKTPKPTMN